MRWSRKRLVTQSAAGVGWGTGTVAFRFREPSLQTLRTSQHAVRWYIKLEHGRADGAPRARQRQDSVVGHPGEYGKAPHGSPGNWRNQASGHCRNPRRRGCTLARRERPRSLRGGTTPGDRLVPNRPPLHGWRFRCLGGVGPDAPPPGLWPLLSVHGLAGRRGRPDPGRVSQNLFQPASFDTARGSLQVWITTMTRNLLVDNFRRTKNQRATGSLDEGWDQTEELKPIDRLTSKGPSPARDGGPQRTGKNGAGRPLPCLR